MAIKLNGKWSLNFNECIRCKTINMRHAAKGLCKNCYRVEDYHKKHPNVGIGRWSRHHDNCIKCNTIKFRHEGKGLCIKCYNKSKNKGIPPLKRENRNCSFCGNNISRPPSLMNKMNIFCDKSCLINWKKENSNGENNTFYGKHHTDLTKKNISNSWTKEKREKMSINKRGPNNPFYGKSHSLESIKKRSGINSSLWRGGTSFEPYTLDFNNYFKKSIKKRDGYSCQICHLFEEDAKKLYNNPLMVHHIDYNKLNSFPQNCISLCVSCHTKTNTNRESWTVFFQDLLKRLYNYQYTEDQKIILDFIGDKL